MTSRASQCASTIIEHAKITTNKKSNQSKDESNRFSTLFADIEQLLKSRNQNGGGDDSIRSASDCQFMWSFTKACELLQCEINLDVLHFFIQSVESIEHNLMEKRSGVNNNAKENKVFQSSPMLALLLGHYDAMNQNDNGTKEKITVTEDISKALCIPSQLITYYQNKRKNTTSKSNFSSTMVSSQKRQRIDLDMCSTVWAPVATYYLARFVLYMVFKESSTNPKKCDSEIHETRQPHNNITTETNKWDNSKRVNWNRICGIMHESSQSYCSDYFDFTGARVRAALTCCALDFLAEGAPFDGTTGFVLSPGLLFDDLMEDSVLNSLATSLAHTQPQLNDDSLRMKLLSTASSCLIQSNDHHNNSGTKRSAAGKFAKLIFDYGMKTEPMEDYLRRESEIHSSESDYTSNQTSYINNISLRHEYYYPAIVFIEADLLGNNLSRAMQTVKLLEKFCANFNENEITPAELGWEIIFCDLHAKNLLKRACQQLNMTPFGNDLFIDFITDLAIKALDNLCTTDDDFETSVHDVILELRQLCVAFYVARADAATAIKKAEHAVEIALEGRNFDVEKLEAKGGISAEQCALQLYLRRRRKQKNQRTDDASESISSSNSIASGKMGFMEFKPDDKWKSHERKSIKSMNTIEYASSRVDCKPIKESWEKNAEKALEATNAILRNIRESCSTSHENNEGNIPEPITEKLPTNVTPPISAPGAQDIEMIDVDESIEEESMQTESHESIEEESVQTESHESIEEESVQTESHENLKAANIHEDTTMTNEQKIMCTDDNHGDKKGTKQTNNNPSKFTIQDGAKEEIDEVDEDVEADINLEVNDECVNEDGDVKVDENENEESDDHYEEYYEEDEDNIEESDQDEDEDNEDDEQDHEKNTDNEFENENTDENENGVIEIDGSEDNDNEIAEVECSSDDNDDVVRDEESKENNYDLDHNTDGGEDIEMKSNEDDEVDESTAEYGGIQEEYSSGQYDSQEELSPHKEQENPVEKSLHIEIDQNDDNTCKGAMNIDCSENEQEEIVSSKDGCQTGAFITKPAASIDSQTKNKINIGDISTSQNPNQDVDTNESINLGKASSLEETNPTSPVKKDGGPQPFQRSREKLMNRNNSMEIDHDNVEEPLTKANTNDESDMLNTDRFTSTIKVVQQSSVVEEEAAYEADVSSREKSQKSTTLPKPAAKTSFARNLEEEKAYEADVEIEEKIKGLPSSRIGKKMLDDDSKESSSVTWANKIHRYITPSTDAKYSKEKFAKAVPKNTNLQVDEAAYEADADTIEPIRHNRSEEESSVFKAHPKLHYNKKSNRDKEERAYEADAEMDIKDHSHFSDGADNLNERKETTISNDTLKLKNEVLPEEKAYEADAETDGKDALNFSDGAENLSDGKKLVLATEVLRQESTTNKKLDEKVSTVSEEPMFCTTETVAKTELQAETNLKEASLHGILAKNIDECIPIPPSNDKIKMSRLHDDVQRDEKPYEADAEMDTKDMSNFSDGANNVEDRKVQSPANDGLKGVRLGPKNEIEGGNDALQIDVIADEKNDVSKERSFNSDVENIVSCKNIETAHPNEQVSLSNKESGEKTDKGENNVKSNIKRDDSASNSSETAYKISSKSKIQESKPVGENYVTKSFDIKQINVADRPGKNIEQDSKLDSCEIETQSNVPKEAKEESPKRRTRSSTRKMDSNTTKSVIGELPVRKTRSSVRLQTSATTTKSTKRSGLPPTAPSSSTRSSNVSLSNSKTTSRITRGDLKRKTAASDSERLSPSRRKLNPESKSTIDDGSMKSVESTNPTRKPSPIPSTPKSSSKANVSKSSPSSVSSHRYPTRRKKIDDGSTKSVESRSETKKSIQSLSTPKSSKPKVSTSSPSPVSSRRYSTRRKVKQDNLATRNRDTADDISLDSTICSEHDARETAILKSNRSGSPPKKNVHIENISFPAEMGNNSAMSPDRPKQSNVSERKSRVKKQTLGQTSEMMSYSTRSTRSTRRKSSKLKDYIL